jgi:hypothetical protein
MLRWFVLAREAGRLVCPVCRPVEDALPWLDWESMLGVVVGSGLVVSLPQEAHTVIAASTRKRARNFENGEMIVIIRQCLGSGLVALF